VYLYEEKKIIKMQQQGSRRGIRRQG